jgi:hypothetical protein
VLTAHVAASVGWLGAVTVSLALAVAGLAADDAETARSAYVALELTGWYVLVPLSLSSLATGLVQSLGTAWGLFRHYWVVFKLLINLLATALLLMYMPTLDALANAAAPRREASPVLHAAAAVVLLLTATVLGVYKPRGLTPYGRRRRATYPAPPA